LPLSHDEPFLELLERAWGATVLSLDYEFHGEKRYRPTLYLVQIGVNDEVAAVDPARVDLRPLRPLLEDDEIRKLFHAGREDIRLLVRATGASAIVGVFDTQVAAAFLGHGLTVGYARLVKELLGVDLDKSNQFTDWSRELTAKQVDYALNDVRYLPRVAAILETELARRGRLGWALEASRSGSLAALTDPDPRRLYRKISGFAKLGEIELGRLRELAMWRDAVAESELPARGVVNDAGLKQLALDPPARHAQLRGTRGVGIGGSKNGGPRGDAHRSVRPNPSRHHPSRRRTARGIHRGAAQRLRRVVATRSTTSLPSSLASRPSSARWSSGAHRTRVRAPDSTHSPGGEKPRRRPVARRPCRKDRAEGRGRSPSGLELLR
jgi:ribonuclease D